MHRISQPIARVTLQENNHIATLLKKSPYPLDMFFMQNKTRFPYKTLKLAVFRVLFARLMHCDVLIKVLCTPPLFSSLLCGRLNNLQE